MNNTPCVHRYVDYKNGGVEVSCAHRAINAQHGWHCHDHKHLCDKPKLIAVLAPVSVPRSLTDSIIATDKAAIAAGAVRKVRLGAGNYLRFLDGK